jgi:hypothetical protein
MISSRDNVQHYLDDFCPVAKREGVSIRDKRADNRAFMEKHELSLSDIQASLGSLRVEDYSSGPEDDNNSDRRGQCVIWKFGPDFHDIFLYVKLADWFNNHLKQRHHCISFKEARPALTLPFQGNL